MHLCWVTAHLYEEHVFISVTAVTIACCYSDLQSSTEQWGMHCALNRAAVHFCWVTAYLYDEFIFTGVTTMTHCLL